MGQWGQSFPLSLPPPVCLPRRMGTMPSPALQLCSPDCVSFSSGFFPSFPLLFFLSLSLKVRSSPRSFGGRIGGGGQTK